MDIEPVAGEEFARALTLDEAHDRFAHPDRPLVVVDAAGLPSTPDDALVDRMATLPAVIVALVDEPGAGAAWADLVLSRNRSDAAALATLARTVTAQPLAATTLAVLLRNGGGRSVADGLVAESTAYGLLQGGPEFSRWRTSRAVKRPAEGPGPAVLVDRRDGELRITLNRPRRRNALDSSMRDGLVEALQIAVIDPSITSVHLDGAGPSFCSGGDLDEFGARSDPVSAHLLRLARSPARLLAEVADRVVVHLHGDAVGSGIELAAFARRVTAAPDTRISLPEVHLGLIPGAGGTVSIARRIGRHRTLFLALATESVDAATALDWGLVDDLDG
jgi:Enoyl-CoA hydratase/isomerase